MKHSKNFSMINRRLLGWKGTLPYSHEGHSGEGGNCNSENEKSTSLDGEFDDSQFSSEDEHGNVADSAATNVVEEFGSSIAQINEVDCVDSEDELRSISSNSDVEEGSNSSLVFSESKFNLEDFQFQEGMIFKDNKEFKWAVERYEALRKKDVYFVKNEPRESNENCPFTIKTYRLNHSCGEQHDNQLIKSGFLAKYYKDEFKLNEEWGRVQFQRHVKKKFRCNISKFQSFRAKQKAKLLVTGSQNHQYNLLLDYCEELKKTNPGTSVKLILDNTYSMEGRSRFKRLYICYGACKEGFLNGCRPLIGVDGCHLKGNQNGGQLLSAVGVDANNNMYPIAFAVVEGELNETWKWFLELLDGDLHISQNPIGWTFISDKQKGLVPAFEELFPYIEHRHCVRHLHANFSKDGYGGQVMKQNFWAACRSTTESEFQKHLEGLRLLNPKAAQWILDREPRHFCRAYFSDYLKSDMLLNNLCESFNSSIRHARDKYILTMCESLRIYLMSRMQKNRDKMKGSVMKICPKIIKILEQNKAHTGDLIAYKANDDNYQVEDISGFFKTYKVNLNQRCCSCRRWDLNGIPCSHAIAAIRTKGEVPEDYVHHCYTVEAYMRSYKPAIMPIHPSDLWTKTGQKPPLPPKYKVQPGRPKKLRKRDPIENESIVGDKLISKLSRKGEKKKCSICGQYGHNKRSCKNQRQNDVEPPAEVEVEHPVATEVEVEHPVANIAAEVEPLAVEVANDELVGQYS
ncbi:PREDICTED: uncharacterized protein LOC109179472 [Ipomoea nil]|uniref:uncharacterized protein LOC109179472 n=1 Tax=Ipomoea nil TaxID=35883 RepID=UPI00090100AE|nr:PREDICTED: uncharacterized protein LOC109179472 [Ipomoea nil]